MEPPQTLPDPLNEVTIHYADRAYALLDRVMNAETDIEQDMAHAALSSIARACEAEVANPDPIDIEVGPDEPNWLERLDQQA